MLHNQLDPMPQPHRSQWSDFMCVNFPVEWAAAEKGSEAVAVEGRDNVSRLMAGRLVAADNKWLAAANSL